MHAKIGKEYGMEFDKEHPLGKQFVIAIVEVFNLVCSVKAKSLPWGKNCFVIYSLSRYGIEKFFFLM